MRLSRPVPLFCLLLTGVWGQVGPRIPPQKQDPAIAEGQVVNGATGQPLPHVAVTLRHNIDTPNPDNIPGGFSMETDDAGTFHFEKIDPGKYSLTASKTGYLRTSFGAKRINGPGIPVILEAGKTASKLDLKMCPKPLSRAP